MKFSPPNWLFGLLAAVLFSMLLSHELTAQEREVGLMRNQVGRSAGYALFQPVFGSGVYLIDTEGMLVHSWTSEYPQGLVSYLLEDGNLLRASSQRDNPVLHAGGATGLVERLDWDSNVLWTFELNDETARLHHDIEPLPNGNILMIAWEFRSTEEAFEMGRDTTGLGDSGMWPLRIIEIEPADSAGGEIVWQWRAWDHMVQNRDSTKLNFGFPSEHPELININHTNFGGDFIHANAIDYNPHLEQIAISTPTFNEIWIIDHSTTIEEASSHSGGNSGAGGDLLYRWGNPRAYAMGDEADQVLYFQHDVRWIPDGYRGQHNLMIFNNGRNRPDGEFSEIFEIEPPNDGNGGYTRADGFPFGPDGHVWAYTSIPSEEFYSPIISGAHRVWNGNTFITSGVQGRIFEVTPSGSIVWEYESPIGVGGPIPINVKPDSLDNRMFRATKYPVDYAAFEGRDLTPIGPLELAPLASADEVPDAATGITLLGNYPNPASGTTSIQFALATPSRVTVGLFDELGRLVEVIADDEWHQPGTVNIRFDAAGLAPGVYFYTVKALETSVGGRILVAR